MTPWPALLKVPDARPLLIEERQGNVAEPSAPMSEPHVYSPHWPRKLPSLATSMLRENSARVTTAWRGVE